MGLFLLLLRARTNIHTVISGIAYRLLLNYCNFLALALNFLRRLIAKYRSTLLLLSLLCVIIFHDGRLCDLTGYFIFVSVMIVRFVGDHLRLF